MPEARWVWRKTQWHQKNFIGPVPHKRIPGPTIQKMINRFRLMEKIERAKIREKKWGYTAIIVQPPRGVVWYSRNGNLIKRGLGKL